MLAGTAAHGQSENDLERMAHSHFSNLTECEQRLLQAAPIGETAYCGPSNRNDDPLNDAQEGDKWDRSREVNASLIRWLCVDRVASQLIDPKGIQIHGARVVGKLDLNFVNVPFRIRIVHSRFRDPIDLMYAKVPELNLGASWTEAIEADELQVTGSILLRDGFHADGEVDLRGATIGADLICVGGTFVNPGDYAIRADGVRATDILMDDGFRAEGEVNLVRANLGADLKCDRGTFINPSGDAIDATEITAADLLFRKGFRAEGAVKLRRARVAGVLDSAGGTFTALDLRQAAAGTLKDDTASWPPRGKLNLLGFVYGAIAEDTPDIQLRLDWLSRQPQYSRQPYEQLAKVLAEAGNAAGSRRVLIAMEDQDRTRGPLNALKWYWRMPAKFWKWVLKLTIGYGYAPWRALYCSLMIVALGAVLFWAGKRNGVIVPTNEKAESHFPFSPFWYSLDSFLPIVNLHQNDHWIPRPSHDGVFL
ncbi:MAG: hypothetical protein ACLQDV_22420 [Candidatus Binataceae bacterium]